MLRTLVRDPGGSRPDINVPLRTLADLAGKKSAPAGALFSAKRSSYLLDLLLLDCLLVVVVG